MPTHQPNRQPIPFNPRLVLEDVVAAGKAPGDAVSFVMSLAPMSGWIRQWAKENKYTFASNAGADVERLLLSHAKSIGRRPVQRPRVEGTITLSATEASTRMSLLEMAKLIARQRKISLSEAMVIADDLERKHRR